MRKRGTTEEETSCQSGRNLCISDRLRQRRRRRRRNAATTMTTSSEEEEEKKWSQQSQYSPTESAADGRLAAETNSEWSRESLATLGLERLLLCCRGLSATAWLNWRHRVVQSVGAGRKSRHSSPSRTFDKIFCVRGSQSDRAGVKRRRSPLSRHNTGILWLKFGERLPALLAKKLEPISLTLNRSE